MSQKPANANSYNRLTVAVNRIEQHEEEGKKLGVYAYGYNVENDQPVRVRLMAVNELAINSLQIHSNVYQVRGSSRDMPEFMRKSGSKVEMIPVDEGLSMLEKRSAEIKATYTQKNSRETLAAKAGRIGELGIINFDDALPNKNEQLGPYKSYSARWSNFLSTTSEASFIRAMGTITTSTNSFGEKQRELQLVEAIYPLQLPSQASEPAVVQKANLEHLIRALSNSNNRQGERMPFVVANIISTEEKTQAQQSLIDDSKKGPKAKNFNDVPAIDRIAILPAIETRQRESRVDADFDELTGEVNTGVKHYQAASDPRTTLTQYMALDDYYTNKLREAKTSTEPVAAEDIQKLERKVFAADKTRAVLSAILGSEPKFALSKDEYPQRFNAVSKIYDSLRNGDTRLELLVGQKLQIGARYQDVLDKHYKVSNHPINALEKATPNNKKINVFAELNIAIQPFKNSENVFVSGVEPVSSARSQTVTYELSELQPSNTNSVFKVRSLKDTNEFDWNKLPEPKSLYEKQFASEKVMNAELEKKKEKSNSNDAALTL